MCFTNVEKRLIKAFCEYQRPVKFDGDGVSESEPAGLKCFGVDADPSDPDFMTDIENRWLLNKYARVHLLRPAHELGVSFDVAKSMSKDELIVMIDERRKDGGMLLEEVFAIGGMAVPERRFDPEWDRHRSPGKVAGPRRGTL